VEKKDGTKRMCIDYKSLNEVTVKDKYPAQNGGFIRSVERSQCVLKDRSEVRLPSAQNLTLRHTEVNIHH
jgi:hypothetical protein